MKYGLQLRAPPSQQKKQLTRPPLRPAIFSDDHDEDVDGEIARQATKKKVIRDVEEQHKKALEEDPSVFDYDGVYDQMKEATAAPVIRDRQKKESKYIHTLMAKAKEREREHEVVYDRKLAKERSKEDHLYADKEKFVTKAYKEKLAEQAKWLEEERLRERREEKNDVTKKSDISEFYYNLTKNVAFGAKTAESKLPLKEEEKKDIPDTPKIDVLPMTNAPSSSRTYEDRVEPSALSEKKVVSPDVKSEPSTSTVQESIVSEQPVADQPKQDNHKKSEDALSAAKERFLARKRAKLQ